jgi:NhaA family Na+:H+ antiporter
MNIRDTVKQKRIILKLVQPFQDFIRLESSAGLLLLGNTIVALVWANSMFSAGYFGALRTEVTIGFGIFSSKMSILHWINDILMCVFFLVVGLEIKRELVIGELVSFKRAVLPILGAIGGMIVPALIYISLNYGGINIVGWGIPVATDIAFSLGILILLGKRIPNQLKVFLTAFAIVDDLGAILIIALFYGTQLQIQFLLISGALTILLAFANWFGIRHLAVYLIVGIVLAFTMLGSGIHASVAGVILAFTIPVRSKIDRVQFKERIFSLLHQFSSENDGKNFVLLDQKEQSIVQSIEVYCHDIETPLQRVEHEFHPWVSYLILPLFALTNAGVVLAGSTSQLMNTPVALGIIFGLIIGKPLGISLFSWIALKIKIADLPSNISFKHIVGVSFLGGIGFTMSLFVANLAFPDSELLKISKLSIMLASCIAGCLGVTVLYILTLHEKKN